MTSRNLCRLYGACAALYLMTGRWTPIRLAHRKASSLASGAADDYERLLVPFYTEPRFWLVIILASAGLTLKGRRDRTTRTLALPFIGYFFYVLLSWFWSPDGLLATEKAYEVGLVAVATMSLLHLYASSHGESGFNATLAALFAISSLFAGLALVAVATGGSDGRIAVLGGGPNVFARAMGLLVLIALYWSRRHPPIMLPVACAGVILVILSGSRGGLVALVAALCVHALMGVGSLRRLVLPGAAAVGLVAVLLTSTPIGEAALESFHDRIELLLIQDRYTAGRDELYRSALELANLHPVLGAGLAGFTAHGYGSYPHNLFLELLSEQGILGLLAWLGAMGAAWRIGSRMLVGHHVALAGFALFLVSSQFSGDFYDCRAVYLFAVASACVPGHPLGSRATQSSRNASYGCRPSAICLGRRRWRTAPRRAPSCDITRPLNREQ